MHSIATLLILATALLVGCGSPVTGSRPASEAQLVELKAVDVAAENGKTLNATFRELVRAADHSLVQVTVLSGGSVSTSMFTLRGLCAVVRARGERFGSSEPVAGENRTFRLRFPKAPAPEQLHGANKSAFSLDECNLLGY